MGCFFGMGYGQRAEFGSVLGKCHIQVLFYRDSGLVVALPLRRFRPSQPLGRIAALCSSELLPRIAASNGCFGGGLWLISPASW